MVTYRNGEFHEPSTEFLKEIGYDEGERVTPRDYCQKIKEELQQESEIV